jgi:hypothetical protein
MSIFLARVMFLYPNRTVRISEKTNGKGSAMIFTIPWSAVRRWHKAGRVLAAEVCAENNFSYFKFEVAPVPRAAKPDF